MRPATRRDAPNKHLPGAFILSPFFYAQWSTGRASGPKSGRNIIGQVGPGAEASRRVPECHSFFPRQREEGEELFHCPGAVVPEREAGMGDHPSASPGRSASDVVVAPEGVQRPASEYRRDSTEEGLVPQVGVDIPRSGEAVQLFAKSSDSDCANLQVSH